MLGKPRAHRASGKVSDMTMPRIISALAIAPLLVACSSSAPVEQAAELPAPQPAAALPTWKAGDQPAEWVCHDPATGVAYSMKVPTDTAEPRIAAAEAFRTKAGAEPVHYLLVDIDATAASAPGSHEVWGASWATIDHQNAGASRLMVTAISTWPGWSSNPGAGMPEIEQDANSGAKGFAILEADQPITSMVGPMVTIGATQVPCELYPPE